MCSWSRDEHPAQVACCNGPKRRGPHSWPHAVVVIAQVLDEAYIEFAGEESKLKWVQEHDNLIVLRTFSKSAGGSETPPRRGACALQEMPVHASARLPLQGSTHHETTTPQRDADAGRLLFLSSMQQPLHDTQVLQPGSQNVTQRTSESPTPLSRPPRSTRAIS